MLVFFVSSVVLLSVYQCTERIILFNLNLGKQLVPGPRKGEVQNMVGRDNSDRIASGNGEVLGTPEQCTISAATKIGGLWSVYVD